MADEKLLTEDDDLEIVEVETLPAPGATPKVEDRPDPADDKDDPDDKDDGDHEDARLVADDDDDDEDDPGVDKDSPAHKKRAKRRQMQKAARDRTLNELAALRQQNEDLIRRVSAVEGTALNTSEAQVDQRLNEARSEIEQADRILAAAIAAGNGDDAAAALRLRDQARDAERELTRVKGTYTKARETPVQPTGDPRTASLMGQWKAANPWYDQKGGNEDSLIVNAIDSQIAREGFQPNTEAYWQELTKRVTRRLNPPAPDKGSETTRRRAPPQGQTREHAPVSTRKEVYVTPERKQAMILAGKWDDPTERRKMLKAYEQYDREQSAGN